MTNPVQKIKYDPDWPIEQKQAYADAEAVQKVERPEHFPKNGTGKSYLIPQTDAYMDHCESEIAKRDRYASLCSEHAEHCDRGHMPSTTCVRCLLTKATLMRLSAEHENADLKSKLETANRDNQNLKLAIGLSCEFHGCGSSECSPKSYLDDARALISKVGKLESELAKHKESADGK